MGLEKILEPRSVVVVGVSTSAWNLARNVVANFLEFGFRGEIYMVGRRPGQVFGREIVTDFKELPTGIDLAVILTPAKTVPDVLENCGVKGIRNAVIMSGGFAELGEEGERLQDRLMEVSARYGISFVGPNCLGVLNPSAGMGGVFMPVKRYWRDDQVSIVAQSGGVGVSYLYGLASENLGLAKFASIGNKLSLDECDFLEYLRRDDRTKMIGLYLESITEGRRFVRAIRSAGKPVFVHKANRFEVSREVAFSHTAALTTDDTLVTVAVEQAGGIRVNTIEQMLWGMKGFLMPPLKGDRLGIIARSGGYAVMAADHAAAAGFQMPPYPKELLDSIGSTFANKVIARRNPLDLGDIYSFDAFADVMRKVAALDCVDAVVMIHEYFSVIEGEESRKLVPEAARTAQRFGKPVVLVLVTDAREIAHLKQATTYPFFQSIEAAFFALNAVRQHRLRPRFEEPSPDDLPAIHEARKKVLAAKAAGERWHLTLHESLQVLRELGVPVARCELAGSPGEVAKAARRVGFPVALKASWRSVQHKSDVGAVILDVKSEQEAIEAARKLFERFGPTTGHGEGVLLQAMAADGTEWFVGGRRDQVFGPVVTVGLGGVWVELFGDVATGLAPVSAPEARQMILRTKASRLLTERFRGREPGDLEALADVAHLVSMFMAGCPEVMELDLNPCVVHPSPQGITVVDARILAGTPV